jgi:hypothetical protein
LLAQRKIFCFNKIKIHICPATPNAVKIIIYAPILLALEKKINCRSNQDVVTVDGPPASEAENADVNCVYLTCWLGQ